MRGSRPKQSKSLAKFIDGELKHKNLNDLSTDGLNLMNLLTLITDIEYRYKYGGSSDWQNQQVNNYEVLADQLTPVDDTGSARLASTGVN